MFSRRSRLLPILLIALIGVVGYRPLLGWLRSLPRVQEIRPDKATAIKPKGSAPPVAISENDWPGWRGALLTGMTNGSAPVLPFCVPEDVVWKINVPGHGHASPVVCGNDVFLLTSDELTETISLLAFEAESGTEKWMCELHQGGFERLHQDNTHASSTPVCDGTALFSVSLIQHALHVSKVDLNGNLVWQTEAGPYESFHGYGASPLLYQHLVIVGGDNHGRGFLSAIDRQSGELIWRTARQNLRSQGTPTIASWRGQDVVIYAGQSSVTSYHPLTGEELWQVVAAADETANTPTSSGDLLFTTGGYPQHCVQAIQLDGNHEIAWEQKVNVYVPSLLVSGNRLLAVQDNGVARLFETTTGKDCGTRRLGGDVSASPVGVGEMAVVINENGRVFFFRIADRLELVGQTDLGTPTYASPAIANGRVFLRTTDSLFCVDAPDMKMK